MQIVEGYREGNKVRQRTIAHLGVVKSKEDLKRLKDIADKLVERLEKEGLEIDHKIALKDLKHKRTIYDGFSLVIDKLMTMTNFDKIIQPAQGKRQFDLITILKLLLVQRFDLPGSKLRAQERQEEYGFEGIDLQHIYRTMDVISTLDSTIQTQAFEAACRVTKGVVDCFFFDVTTLYFESVTQDELREFGFSKDQKHHSVQIVLALVVDGQGLPIGYEVFKGNIAETKTLVPVLANLRARFSISNVTVVCDRGLASRSNVEALQEAGFHFVVATKLRSISKRLKINDLDCYEFLPGQDNLPEEERVRFRVMEHPQYERTQLIATYSPSRAKKDREDRERLLEKLKTKLSSEEASVKKVISNGGYKKYTTVKEGSLLTLNEKAISEDAQWDGFHGIAVSESARLSVGEALVRYRDLWRVEEAFRVVKCTLKTRPIFHWAPHRIKSHILICFMNLFFERLLEWLLRQQGVELTPDRIKYALGQVHTTVFEDEKTKQEGRMESRLPLDAEKIFQVLGITTQRRTFSSSQCCA